MALLARSVLDCILRNQEYKPLGSMWFFFALSVPTVLLLTVGLLRYYKGADVPLDVQLSVALGWLFSLFVVILVPIDVVTVCGEERLPSS